MTTDPVSTALAVILERNAAVTDGHVADYIPELAKADPDDFGVAVVSVLGRVYEAGDSTKQFTIQSISKPFVYAMALDALGLDAVAPHVGFEPSGEPFNAISLEEGTGRPANPMINAGAIVTSSLIDGATPDERFERIRAGLSAFAGRELALDETVYRSESATGDRNRALAHLARAGGALRRDVDDAVDVYFRQCSLLVTASDIAVMAATLANGGVNPLTGERVVSITTATLTLSVMATCGMYDDSGEWMVRVGLPAKSGVGGGIVAALPGEFGIGVYSPPLDDKGNSARGVATLADISERFELHMLRRHQEPRSPVHSSDADPAGDGAWSIVLRGEIDFNAAEQIADHLRAVARRHEPMTVRLDFTDVTAVRPSAEQLLAATVGLCGDDGCDVFAHDPEGVLQGLVTLQGATLRRS